MSREIHIAIKEHFNLNQTYLSCYPCLEIKNEWITALGRYIKEGVDRQPEIGFEKLVGERILGVKKTLKDVSTVAELETFLTRPEFRQNPENLDQRDYSEFEYFLYDEAIAPETWIRYYYKVMDGKGFNLKPLWEDVKRSKEWVILGDYEFCHLRTAVDPVALKILSFVFGFPSKGRVPTDLWVVKLEFLSSQADLQRRLKIILNYFVSWADRQVHGAYVDYIIELGDKYGVWEK